MPVRHLGILVLGIILTAQAALAIDTGKAEGSVTINKKAVKMKYAFAKMDKDFEDKDRVVVLLTDKPLSRSMLADDSRISDAVEKGELVATEVRFDSANALEQAEIKSKAAEHKALPISASSLELTGLSTSGGVVEATVKSTADQEFFKDKGSMSVKFRAAIGKGRYAESAASTADLIASRPKIADNTAKGALKLDGATIPLTHAIARTKPSSFDETKKEIIVLLTNEAVPNDFLLDDQKLFEAVEKGKLRGLKVSFDADEKPYHMQILDPKAPIQLSGTGFWNFDAIDFSEKHMTARFFSDGQQRSGSEHQYSYDVNFAVPVQAILAPDEVTVDETTGTKLPANGGDPGKAYLAFDKASRAGNLNELRKFASKHRPVPENLSAEEIKEMLEMVKLMRPAKVKITGGYVAGDHATLRVDGEEAGSKTKMRGRIEMSREDGVWRVVAEKWRQ